jgi:glycoside/pentoside/hexuronide:cation symporter, GPH family
MQAEVIDYDELYTGRRREAQYAGFWSILPKLAAIPSAALPIALLASLGYVPNAVQRPEVSHAIRILYRLGPAVAAAASLTMILPFPNKCGESHCNSPEYRTPQERRGCA